VGLVAIMFSRHRQTLSDKFCDIVVIDERKAGFTFPWVLPGRPVMEVPPPEPQGGVPWPTRPAPQTEHPAHATYDLGAQPRPDESPESDPDDDDLPEFEFADQAGPDLDDPPDTEVADEPVRPRSAPPPPEAPVPPAAVPDDGPPWSDLPPMAGRPPRPTPAPPPTADDPAGATEQPSPDESNYFTDAAIAEAIRAGKIDRAHELARDAIEAYWDMELLVDIPDAVAEYRALIRKQGKAIRADDATVARWLGLGN
jgi:hypothetical protein